MSLIPAKDAGNLFPGIDKTLWGRPVEYFAIKNFAFGYHVVGQRTEWTGITVTGSFVYRTRALDGSVSKKPFSLFSANLHCPTNVGEPLEVFEAHDYRGDGAQDVLPYRVASLFRETEETAKKLRSALERIQQLAGLSGAEGEQPLLTDLLRAKPAEGVEQPEMHLAEIHTLRNYALSKLGLLLPKDEVARLQNVTEPLRPDAVHTRTDDPKVVVFKLRVK